MKRIRRTTVNWPDYLTAFHTQHPGITEAVLNRCARNGRTPYEWLLDGASPTGRILDLGCGSAPTRPTGTGRWVGLDRSRAELDAARGKHANHLVLGDGLFLPFRDDTFDVVVCAMALMLISPLDRALFEIARVLEPDGTLHVLVPSTRPVTWTDRARFARIGIALRTPPRFPPTPLTHTARDAFARGGFTVEHDERRRYDYPIDRVVDADRLIDSLYLPNTSRQRRNNACTVVRRWRGHTVGIPLRKIICTLRSSDSRHS